MYFEGDMILNEEQKCIYLQNGTNVSTYNGLIDEKYRWPGKTVVYQISRDFTNDQRRKLQEVIQIMDQHSCVRFVERTEQTNYVNIIVSEYRKFYENKL